MDREHTDPADERHSEEPPRQPPPEQSPEPVETEDETTGSEGGGPYIGWGNTPHSRD